MRKIKYTGFLILTTLLLTLSFCTSAKKEKSGKWFNDAKTASRVDSVLSLMTLEEKIGQLTLFTSDYDVTGPVMREGYIDDIKAGRVGAIFNAFGADYTMKLQKMAVEETRLGIPLLFGYDVIHGHRTIFPIPLGEAASWDLEYIEKASRIAAIEASSEGLHWTFAPMIDISMDPRWGRVAESAGEDPYLTSRIAEAKIRGFQGDDLSDIHTMLACAKHFAAYGAAQAGRDYHTVDMSEITLRNIYLPPFKASVDAGVATFMTAFNELFAVPATGSKFLLTDVLRDEWNFNGFVVTDYTSINEMVLHGFAKDEKHAGELAINAGVDMDMQGAVFYDYLKKSLEEGIVTEKTIDRAVRRILNLKFELGLFDDPYRYSDTLRQKNNVMTEEHLEFARDFAKRSIVLLKNGKKPGSDIPALPLEKDIKRIAVIGPLADNQKELIGSWSAAGDYTKSVTLLQGIKNKLGNKTQVIYAKGANINDDSKDGFAEAVRIARSSDVIILAIGEYALMSGEAASRSNINLPGVQEELALELAKTGRPLIVVLMNGRPLTIEKIDEHASAILETWFLGTTTGDAVADVLFGDYNPSGKLTVTFPRTVGQIPIHYNMKNTGRPESEFKYTSKYSDVPNTPLYPFGFGLSYTTFAYSDISLSSGIINNSDTLTASVVVKNTGKIAGEEVVQLYTRQLVGSITRPVKELKGFKKVSLEPEESLVVSFHITANDLAFYNAKNEFAAEPGKFHLLIGTSSENVKLASFEFQK
jgi:beta-glucosidase